MIRKYVLPLVAIALLGFAVLHVVKAQQTPPVPPPPIEPASAAFSNTVAGAGIIEAKSENIAIASPLPGLVVEVFVKVGDEVKQGDPLFRLDDRAMQADKKVKQAAVNLAEKQLARLDEMPRKDERPVKDARLAETQANLEDQRDLFDRAKSLYDNKSIGEEEMSRRRQAYIVAKQQVAYAQADLELWKAGAWEADKEVARAAITQAKVQVQQIETDLKRLTVAAPIAGKVLQVNVRAGEYAGAPPNQTLMIMGDVSTLHVRVDVDEHDIPRFRPGAEAVCTLRGHPQKRYSLTFVRVEPYVVPKKSLTGDNTERVDTRVLQVIYALKPNANGVHVGQQVEVSINAEKSGSDAK